MNHRDLAIHALQQLEGDDLPRARAAFRRYTAEQMHEQHGESGRTRAEILAGYEAHAARIAAAIAWVRSVPDA